MDSSQIPARQSLAQDWLDALRYWLGGRRGLMVLAGLVAVAGIAFNWSWLMAVGIAPLLLSALPCVAMCAIGLCASKMAGRSCSVEPDGARAPMPEVAERVTATVEPSSVRAAPARSDVPALSEETVAADAAAIETERHPALKEGN
ncbi:MAG: hypothetical protein ACREGK_04790 [Geminicoccales bacterium]